MREGARNLSGLHKSGIAAALAACLAGLGALDDARAFDFFGLWGSGEAPPAVSSAAIAYGVTIDVAGGDSVLTNAVMDASSAYKLRQDAPPDGDSLARR